MTLELTREEIRMIRMATVLAQTESTNDSYWKELRDKINAQIEEQSK